MPLDKSDYIDILPSDFAIELLKNKSINAYIIKLVEVKQPSYGFIYALTLVKPKTLKIYIKIYLKTGFILPSKSSVGVSILFDKKPDGIFCLYINY